MFADDRCLFLSHKDPKVNEIILSEELQKFCDWLTANKLSLNVTKTNVMFFRNKHDSSQSLANVKIGDKIVEEVSVAKYLGILTDHK